MITDVSRLCSHRCTITASRPANKIAGRKESCASRLDLGHQSEIRERPSRISAALIRTTALGRRRSFGLIGQPGEAFVATKHRQHVENARRRRASGQRRPQRLRDLAELDRFALGNGELPSQFRTGF